MVHRPRKRSSDRSVRRRSKAGTVIRHKGRPTEEERPARFPAPVDPGLFDRVQAIRAERRTRHPGGMLRRRPYPLAWLIALRPLWELLGLVAVRKQRLTTQRQVGLVGARGVKTTISMALD